MWLKYQYYYRQHSKGLPKASQYRSAGYSLITQLAFHKSFFYSLYVLATRGFTDSNTSQEY